MRDIGCRDCQQLTSGDCGKHGPIVYGSANAQMDPSSHLAATMMWLKAECERQHARADKAEAKVAELEAALIRLRGAQREEQEDDTPKEKQ